MCRLIRIYLQFFTVPVYGSNGAQLSTQQLIDQLKRVLEQSQTTAPPVGILGTDNRDTWYKAYTKMCKGTCISNG